MDIEEDIEKVKKLNNLLKFFKTHGWIPNMSRNININGTIEAIEHILAEREEDKKKIKYLEKENEELLEVKISVSAKNTIHNLKKENIKLEERCFMAEGNLKTTKEELRDYFYNSIPKQKIKEKIKDLEYNSSLGFEETLEETYKIEILQELLEDK